MLRVVPDTGTHLLGSSRLLNALSHLADISSLCKAAIWVVLRQDIYLALVRWRPLSLDLQNYSTAEIFSGFNEDDSFANQAVFLFAQILNSCVTSNHLSQLEWQDFDQRNETWLKLKPASFEPLWKEHDASNAKPAFPTAYMLLPSHGKSNPVIP